MFSINCPLGRSYRREINVENPSVTRNDVADHLRIHIAVKTCVENAVKYMKFLTFFFFYNTVMVIAIHQHEYAIGVHMSPPS